MKTSTSNAVRERPIPFTGKMVRAILAGAKTQTRRVVKPQPSSEWCPVVGKYHPTVIDRHGEAQPGDGVFGASDENEGRVCPYGGVGDLLWVRETWRPASNAGPYNEDDGSITITYAADGATRYIDDWGTPGDWCIPKAAKRGNVSPYFMPRWASRLTLEITDVRVQRVGEINEFDAIAEGVEFEIPAGAIPKNVKFPDGFDGWKHNRQEEWFGRTARAAYMAQCVGLSNALEAYIKLWDSINGARNGCKWASNPWVWCIAFRRIEP